MIAVKHVYTNLSGKQLYSDLNLSVDSGQVMAIVGRSGCGKSVLLKHLMGIMQPDEGEVWIDDVCVNQSSEYVLNKVRRHCGMVFQYGALFDSMTVSENVAFALREDASITDQDKYDMAREKLSWVGLEHAIDLYPSQLSGGMKKRVAIARAIALDPKVILYDEPTTGLDPITVDVINRLMRDLHEKIKGTSIVVTHDMDSVHAVCDDMAMMFQGRFIIQGSVQDVSQSQDPYVQQFLKGTSNGPIGVDVS